jgi:hypothetical protein
LNFASKFGKHFSNLLFVGINRITRHRGCALTRSRFPLPLHPNSPKRFVRIGNTTEPTMAKTQKTMYVENTILLFRPRPTRFNSPYTFVFTFTIEKIPKQKATKIFSYRRLTRMKIGLEINDSSWSENSNWFKNLAKNLKKRDSILGVAGTEIYCTPRNHRP